MPVDNGKLRAMVFGGTREERLQLNEDTLWSGFPRDGVQYDALRTSPSTSPENKFITPSGEECSISMGSTTDSFCHGFLTKSRKQGTDNRL